VGKKRWGSKEVGKGEGKTVELIGFTVHSYAVFESAAEGKGGEADLNLVFQKAILPDGEKGEAGQGSAQTKKEGKGGKRGEKEKG